jgi:hypothetical protein
MSMSETPAPEKAKPKINVNIMSVFAVVPVVLAVLAFFNINKVSDVPGLKKGDSAATDGIQSDIPENPVADGKAYYITVNAPEIGTPEWTSRDIVKDVVFQTEKDRMKWAKLNISSGEHFKDLNLSLSDYDNSSDSGSVPATDVKEGWTWNLKTKHFRGNIGLVKVETDVDPDKEQPYPRVFRKMTLRVDVEER